MFETLFDRYLIDARVRELAKEIEQDYSKEKDIYLVGVLKGAFIFLSDISRLLHIEHTVDFIALSSYGKNGDKRSAVKLVMDLREDIRGKNVLIIEDIVDSGSTLQYLVGMLQGRQPKSIKTCALVRKVKKGVDYIPDYVGFDIPDDVWVVGYGLDYAEKYRTLPSIVRI